MTDGQITRLLSTDDPRSRAHELLAVISAAGVTDEHIAALEELPDAKEHLAVALALRSVSLRSLTHDGKLVMVERAQVDGCERIATRMLELDPPDELRTFALDLQREVASSREWTWEPRGMPVLVLLIVLCALLVLFGGGLASITMVAVGSAGGAALLYALVIRQRKQRWSQLADEAAPLLSRVGR
ncbi:hypothetical protein GCM10010178_21420 [Lentzea flava]|uniref:TIGR04222 domain-containing protein n=1 Tax=Lentzea flava TaxID=103732 RepID=A0ABQ2UF03_9PSEU|nr:hypothetical protein [Lentzea flava]GGU29008.1 hypothetical protein GCM10010178_21420 [Lentzea flava]